MVGRFGLSQLCMLTNLNKPNLSRIAFVGDSPSAELVSVWSELTHC